MNLSSLRRLLIAALLFVISSSFSVLAATVSVTPSSVSTYTAMGTGMDGVAGIQLDIAYDTASLAAPTVTQGGLVAGAMFAANTSRPGLIKIAIISTRAFSGSGQIATISFASKTGSGGITSFTTSMIDSKGSDFAASTRNTSSETGASGTISTPGVPFSQPSQQASPSLQQQTTSANTATSGVSAPLPAYLGTVTLPTEQRQGDDPQPAAPSTTPDYSDKPAPDIVTVQTQTFDKPTAGVKPEETSQHVLYKGTIERFRRYNGSKDFSSMVALFDNKSARTFHQEPAILLSNGQNKAALTVDLPTGKSSSPNIAVNGGRLDSFKEDKKSSGRWTFVILPDAGTVMVTITIIFGTEEFEFPLTVAPLIKTAISLDERGWNRFLKEVGTPTAPLHDLNNDGVRDSTDEFIFVANLLAGRKVPPTPLTTSNQSVK